MFANPTHNQGVPGSCPGGPTGENPNNEPLTKILVGGSFFMPSSTPGY